MDPLVAVRPIHTRTLDVEVCDSGDGAWAARGELVDLRKSGFVPVAGDLQMSGPPSCTLCAFAPVSTPARAFSKRSGRSNRRSPSSHRV